MAFLFNSTFENGIMGWAPINGANLVSTQIVRDGTARSGSSFLRVKVEQPDCSVGSDFTLASGVDFPGQFQSAATRSIGVIAYIRAAPGGPNVSGQLKLWSLGLEHLPINNNGTNFIVGNDWTLVMCALDETHVRYINGGYVHPNIRLEFYIGTPGAYLDIDTVLVC